MMVSDDLIWSMIISFYLEGNSWPEMGNHRKIWLDII